MKYITTIYLLLCSISLYAQKTNQPDTVKINNAKPLESNPNIPVTPAINTTITKNQPSSIPNSNTNPTTGTVISLKSNKNTSKTNRAQGTKADTLPLLKRADSTLNNNGSNSTTPKRTAKKNKAVLKKGN